MSLSHKKYNHAGLTIIELLVTVAILSVLTAILIPRMRIVNKDRNIRESARQVGSLFSSASQRAVAEGGAGILLERHPNFVDTNNVNFACTTMYVMRNLPAYIGDDFNSMAYANSSSNNIVNIDVPLEHVVGNPERQIVQVNDYIRLNNSSVRYRISDVVPRSDVSEFPNLRLELTLDTGGYIPLPSLPPAGASPPEGVPFAIFRQPRKVESSRVELPPGFHIDLRFSGPLNGGGGSVLNEQTNTDTAGTLDFPRNPIIPRANEIRVLLDETGAIDRLFYYSSIPGPAGQIVGAIPTDSLYMFVTSSEIDNAINPITEPSNLWVTINGTTGGVNVGYNAVGSGTIIEARGLASSFQSADQ